MKKRLADEVGEETAHIGANGAPAIMKSSMDCIPRFVRQAIDAVSMIVSGDEERKRLAMFWNG